ncbi:MAG: prolyl oligopeptidase family serine peptidase, partial [Actinomycetota bacterium]
MNREYPAAPRIDVTDNLHGNLVPDPYRWLEDAGSDATREWLTPQDTLYAAHRDAWAGRDAFAARLTELLGAGTVSPPVWRGDRRFFLRRGPGQEHAILYTAAGDGPEQALIDPAQLDPSGITTLDAWQPDQEGRLLAYQLSEGGAEESMIRVMDIETGQDVDGPIERSRYTDVAWLPGGKAFYYSRRLAPGEVPAGEEQFHRRVYLHQVGTPADQDTLIFGEGRGKADGYGISVSRDGRWLIITASPGTAPRNDLWLADLTASSESAPDLRVVQEGVDAQTSIQVGRDGLLYIFTDRDAPRGTVMVADPADLADPAGPGFGSWRVKIAPDDEAVLTGYAILDGAELDRPALLASWTRHAVGEITVHDLATGERQSTLALPGLGTIGGLRERPEGGHEAWFGYTDHTTPAAVYHYDARTGELTLSERAPGSITVPAVTAEQVAYTSKDGTTVRMLIIAGPQERPGPRPTILYGYGGFNISLTPDYAPSMLAWAEAGGIYAVAGLRGGSEEGEEWHRAGMRERKQNVFDDFHAAAEKLIADGLTTREQLSIAGGSNGGLLVGAAITQRPDLYRSAVCSAPLLDMVRYEKFGLGQLWNDEYGTAADPAELAWLLSYSPYHHVHEGTEYPAVLFTIFESDTRVDTLHARKMCAALQYATAGPVDSRPVLLRRESDVGHSSRSVSRTVGLSAETLAFAAR